MQAPPELEQAMGLRAYLTPQPGIGGRLRSEVEDFQVIEVGRAPRPHDEGRFTAARIRLHNWETNRFIGLAARRAGIKPGKVGFAGMKDKRAVTEQWFTFQCPANKVERVAELQDVEILETYRCSERQYAGAHGGNRFVLRVRGGRTDAQSDVDTVADQIRAQGGVPAFFGPQRFGAAFRPITHLVGAAIVAGDLEEAVRLYVGNPMDTERPEAAAARTIYEETRDATKTLAVYPEQLGPERRILERLERRPEDWRYALLGLPGNLLQLFVHAHQSWAFNNVLSARIEKGWALNDVHIGDRVCSFTDDGTHTALVTDRNLDRVRREIAKGRASATAPLPGMSTETAEGEPGELEAKILDDLGMEPHGFRCRELPDLASAGRRRTVLQSVQDLDVSWVDDDPVFAFTLGRGDYATVVVREFMKADVADY